MILSLIMPAALTALVQIASADPFLHAAITEPARPSGRPDITGLASRFGGRRDKKWGRQAMACAPSVVTDERMHVCAHRRLPCGTLLTIENRRNGRRSRCVVADRGPWGKIDADGVWFNGARDRTREDTWRGELDMTPAVAAELGASGLTPVRAWVTGRARWSRARWRR